MIRFCPQCKTERPLGELVCEGEINGRQCGWDLTDLPFRPEGWRPDATPSVEPSAPAVIQCPNGHPAEPGDLLCSICQEDILWPETEEANAETSLGRFDADAVQAANGAQADATGRAGTGLDSTLR